MTAEQKKALEDIRVQTTQLLDAVIELTNDELDKLHEDSDADVYAKANENSDNLIEAEGCLIRIGTLLFRIQEREGVI